MITGGNKNKLIRSNSSNVIEKIICYKICQLNQNMLRKTDLRTRKCLIPDETRTIKHLTIK